MGNLGNKGNQTFCDFHGAAAIYALPRENRFEIPGIVGRQGNKLFF